MLILEFCQKFWLQIVLLVAAIEGLFLVVVTARTGTEKRLHIIMIILGCLVSLIPSAVAVWMVTTTDAWKFATRDQAEEVVAVAVILFIAIWAFLRLKADVGIKKD